MDAKKEFLKIMSEQKEIALATSVNDILSKVMIRLRKWNQTLILHLLQFHTLGMNT